MDREERAKLRAAAARAEAPPRSPGLRSVATVPAVTVRYEPGNGTSYNLVATRDVQGGGSFLWLEGTRVFASGWFGDNDVRWDRKPGNKPDRDAIHAALGLPEVQAVLDERYRRWTPDYTVVRRG